MANEEAFVLAQGSRDVVRHDSKASTEWEPTRSYLSQPQSRGSGVPVLSWLPPFLFLASRALARGMIVTLTFRAVLQ